MKACVINVCHLWLTMMDQYWSVLQALCRSKNHRGQTDRNITSNKKKQISPIQSGSARFVPVTWLALWSCFFIPETDIVYRDRHTGRPGDQRGCRRVTTASIPSEMLRPPQRVAAPPRSCNHRDPLFIIIYYYNKEFRAIIRVVFWIFTYVKKNTIV